MIKALACSALSAVAQCLESDITTATTVIPMSYASGFNQYAYEVPMAMSSDETTFGWFVVDTASP